MQYGYRSEESPKKKPTDFGVAIFLPGYIETLVRPVREKYDPEYSLIAGNITLVSPFRTERALEEVSRTVASVVSGHKVLDIELEGIEDLYPEYPLIVWRLRSNPVIDRLYKRLYTSLDLALPYKHFYPHVTVAREISPHRLMLVKEKIYPYLPHESFQATAIDLVSPVAGDHWVSVRTFSLRPD
jgi:2'-5' RNA ligase